jgi:hypothetical protein
MNRITISTPLEDLLEYDPATGMLRWKRPKGERMQINMHQQSRRQTKGWFQGFLDTDGYRRFAIPDGRHARTGKVRQRQLCVHYVAWYLMTGQYPVNDIDHINQNRADNRWTNLRAASRSENMRNLRVRPVSKTGYIGVSPFGKKFLAQITVNYQNIYLGVFSTLEEAVAVRREAELKYFGEFAPCASR